LEKFTERYALASGVIALSVFLTTFNRTSVSTTESEVSLLQTEVPEDVFLLGPGYFVTEGENQEIYLAKGGRIGVNGLQDLTLTTDKTTRVISPTVHIPNDTKLIWINSIGEVKITRNSMPDQFETAGQLVCGLSTEAGPSYRPDKWLKPQLGVISERLGTTTENYIISGWRVKVSSP